MDSRGSSVMEAEQSSPPRAASVWNMPNILTLSRLGLAIVLFALIHAELWSMALIVFVVAAFTDWLDGYLARKQGLTSALGRNLDPLVDKVLICGAFIFLLPVNGSGIVAWMVTVIVARELIVTGLRSFFEAREVKFGADMAGKIKMFLQCAALIAILLTLSLPSEQRHTPNIIRDVLVWAMVAATVLSGAQYLIKGTMQLR
jgi:CDP-diacylglycerol---glycerol-3-phosphate 3-phosphatidyltransferase